MSNSHAAIELIKPIANSFMDDFINKLKSSHEEADIQEALCHFSLSFSMVVNRSGVEGSDAVLPILAALLPRDLETLALIHRLLIKDRTGNHAVMSLNLSEISQFLINEINGKIVAEPLNRKSIKTINQFMQHFNDPKFQEKCKTNPTIIQHIDACIELVKAQYPVDLNGPKEQVEKQHLLQAKKTRPLNQARRGLLEGKHYQDIAEYMKQAKEMHHDNKTILQRISQAISLLIATITRNEKKREAIRSEKAFPATLNHEINKFFPPKTASPIKPEKKRPKR